MRKKQARVERNRLNLDCVVACDEHLYN